MLFFVGLILVLVVIFVAVPDIFMHPATYFQFNSIIMVFGGVVALFVLSSSASDLRRTFLSLGVILRTDKIPSEREIIDKLVEFTVVSQKSGRAALEGAAEGFDDGFLNNGLSMIVNKLKPEFVRIVLENELQEMSARHESTINNFRIMGNLGPTLGMFGTIIGVIQVLRNMRDPKTVGPAMSLALITSMYGVFVASFLLTPITNKLQSKSDQEILKKTIMIEGLYMIAKGEIPIKVETYLKAFISAKEKVPQKEENA